MVWQLVENVPAKILMDIDVVQLSQMKYVIETAYLKITYP